MKLLEWADLGLASVSIIYLSMARPTNAGLAILAICCHRLGDLIRSTADPNIVRLHNAITRSENITEPLIDLACQLGGTIYYARICIFATFNVLALLLIIALHPSIWTIDTIFYSAIACGAMDCIVKFVETIHPSCFLTDGQFLKYQEVETALANLTNNRGLIYSSPLNYATAKRAILAACLSDGSCSLIHQVKPLIDEIYPENNGYRNMR